MCFYSVRKKAAQKYCFLLIYANKLGFSVPCTGMNKTTFGWVQINDPFCGTHRIIHENRYAEAADVLGGGEMRLWHHRFAVKTGQNKRPFIRTQTLGEDCSATHTNRRQAVEKSGEVQVETTKKTRRKSQWATDRFKK